MIPRNGALTCSRNRRRLLGGIASCWLLLLKWYAAIAAYDVHLLRRPYALAACRADILAAAVLGFCAALRRFGFAPGFVALTYGDHRHALGVDPLNPNRFFEPHGRFGFKARDRPSITRMFLNDEAVRFGDLLEPPVGFLVFLCFVRVVVSRKSLGGLVVASFRRGRGCVRYSAKWRFFLPFITE